MTTTVRRAIAESREHDSIVTIGDATAEDVAALEAECDSSVLANGVHEFWADDPDSAEGMLWRVHARVHGAEVAP